MSPIHLQTLGLSRIYFGMKLRRGWTTPFFRNGAVVRENQLLVYAGAKTRGSGFAFSTGEAAASPTRGGEFGLTISWATT